MKVNNVLRNNASISNTHNKLRAQQDRNVCNLDLKNGTKQNTISNKENTQRVLKNTKLFTANRFLTIQEFREKESDFKNLYLKIPDTKVVTKKLPDQSINMTCSNVFSEDSMNIICNSERDTIQKPYRTNQILEQKLEVDNIDSQSLINTINSPNNLKHPEAEEVSILSTKGQQRLEEHLQKYRTIQQSNGESPPINNNIQDYSDINQSQFKTPEILDEQSNNFELSGMLLSPIETFPSPSIPGTHSTISQFNDDIPETIFNQNQRDDLSINNLMTIIAEENESISGNSTNSNPRNAVEQNQLQRTQSSIPQAPYHVSMDVPLPNTIINSDSEIAFNAQKNKQHQR